MGDDLQTVAALFVQRRGIYAGVPGVDAWDESRDARFYVGPFPVVAHPPCATWGRFWRGGVCNGCGFHHGHDGGCFAAALDVVRRWGGVIEHPEDSRAWPHHGLRTPMQGGGWSVADWEGGWTCRVEQGWDGHRARKATWLYACGVEVEPLQWGRSPRGGVPHEACNSLEERRRVQRTGTLQRMSKKQRAATPQPFRDLLLSIARSAYRRRQSAA